MPVDIKAKAMRTSALSTEEKALQSKSRTPRPLLAVQKFLTQQDLLFHMFPGWEGGVLKKAQPFLQAS